MISVRHHLALGRPRAVDLPPDATLSALACVPHASRGVCDACGRTLPAPVGPGRKPSRFCSETCRRTDLRERRGKARADLAAALGELRHLVVRVERDLTVLGLPRS
jgi:hypothetical protein